MKNSILKKVSAKVKADSFDIQDLIGFKMAKILKLKRRFVDAELKKLKLSRTQWLTLFWLRVLGPCSQKELLKNLDIDAAHLARVLEDFEKNKYIIRAPVLGDRRCLFIQMTPICKRQLLPALEAALEKENNILLDGLNTEDKRYLHVILRKLEKNIETVLRNNE